MLMQHRLFVAPVNAIVPRNGYHVRWYGLWIEEARGITLHALWMAHYHTHSLMLDLLTHQLNQTQVWNGRRVRGTDPTWVVHVRGGVCCLWVTHFRVWRGPRSVTVCERGMCVDDESWT